MQEARESSEGGTFRRSTPLDDLIAARELLMRSADSSGPGQCASSPEPRSTLKLIVISAVTGIVLSLVGGGLVMASFSHTFLEPNPDPAWEDAGSAGAFLFICGGVLVMTSIVASMVVAVRSLHRRLRGQPG